MNNKVLLEIYEFVDLFVEMYSKLKHAVLGVFNEE